MGTTSGKRAPRFTIYTTVAAYNAAYPDGQEPLHR
jgi:hypothetical protein